VRWSSRTTPWAVRNLEVIKAAGWILDLGPEGGVDGGEIGAEGTPEDVVKEPRSFTERHLAPLLAKAGKEPATAD
jgi:excinuclease ABC subunit A